MKKSRKFVKSDGTKENVIKGTAKTLSFHTMAESALDGESRSNKKQSCNRHNAAMINKKSGVQSKNP